ncbi:MAG: hypothetical protein ACM3UU_05990 [Ignavibacteriales bacterium]
MLRRLKNSKGEGSVFPIILMIIVTTVFMISIFLLNLDSNLRELQKDRYIKAVDMAVNTAMANIELSNEDLNNHLSDQQQQIGIVYEASNLDLIASGYQSHKRLIVDKEALMDVFYDVLLRNFQMKGLENVENFQRYIPLKAILQYDTISVSSGMHYDAIRGKYVDDWQDERLFFKSGATNIYMTLEDKCYTVNDALAINQRFLETNKNYFSVNSTNLLGITPEKKRREMARCVENILRSHANSSKLIINESGEQKYYSNSGIGRYQLSFADFDNILHNKDQADKINTTLNSPKDVTFYCIVEGLPMKSLYGQIDNSFVAFSYGGSSLKRADE